MGAAHCVTLVNGCGPLPPSHPPLTPLPIAWGVRPSYPNSAKQDHDDGEPAGIYPSPPPPPSTAAAQGNKAPASPNSGRKRTRSRSPSPSSRGGRQLRGGFGDDDHPAVEDGSGGGDGGGGGPDGGDGGRSGRKNKHSKRRRASKGDGNKDAADFSPSAAAAASGPKTRGVGVKPRVVRDPHFFLLLLVLPAETPTSW